MADRSTPDAAARSTASPALDSAANGVTRITAGSSPSREPGGGNGAGGGNRTDGGNGAGSGNGPGASAVAVAPPDGFYWERARRGATPWIIGAVGLAALGTGQVVVVRHHLESDLRNRSLSALRSAGLPGVTVDFSGRDGRLTGTVPSPADVRRALQAVQALDGVRVATAELHYPPTTPAPAPVPAVRVVTAGDTVTLSGTIGTEAAHQALVSAATRVFGPGHVADRLTVDAADSDAGVAGLGALLAVLGTSSQATVDLSDGSLTLAGSVPDAAAVTAASAAAVAITGDRGKVTNQLVPAQATASPSPVPAASPSSGSSPSPSSGSVGPSAPSGVDDARHELATLPQVTFRTDSAALTPVDRIIVAKAAGILEASPGVTVRIEGHTDDLGDWDVNLALSQARAESVRAALIARGVAAAQLDTVGWSEERPRVPNTSPANRALNRRAELVVVQPS